MAKQENMNEFFYSVFTPYLCTNPAKKKYINYKNIMKQSITTINAPAAIGPYSQAIQTKSFVFLSGQLGINPSTGEFVPGLVIEQTEQVFNNIKAVLAEAHLTLEHVVKTTVFLSDMSDFAAMNAVYAKHFKEPYPARSAVAVKTLPKNALVEIEVIAANE
jgi:2-iminobutanoate/2-iminopropanoate deaminase